MKKSAEQQVKDFLTDLATKKEDLDLIMCGHTVLSVDARELLGKQVQELFHMERGYIPCPADYKIAGVPYRARKGVVNFRMGILAAAAYHKNKVDIIEGDMLAAIRMVTKSVEAVDWGTVPIPAGAAKQLLEAAQALSSAVFVGLQQAKIIEDNIDLDQQK